MPRRHQRVHRVKPTREHLQYASQDTARLDLCGPVPQSSTGRECDLNRPVGLGIDNDPISKRSGEFYCEMPGVGR